MLYRERAKCAQGLYLFNVKTKPKITSAIFHLLPFPTYTPISIYSNPLLCDNFWRASCICKVLLKQWILPFSHIDKPIFTKQSITFSGSNTFSYRSITLHTICWHFPLFFKIKNLSFYTTYSNQVIRSCWHVISCQFIISYKCFTSKNHSLQNKLEFNF